MQVAHVYYVLNGSHSALWVSKLLVEDGARRQLQTLHLSTLCTTRTGSILAQQKA
jgi:hypothetical protein